MIREIQSTVELNEQQVQELLAIMQIVKEKCTVTKAFGVEQTGVWLDQAIKEIIIYSFELRTPLDDLYFKLLVLEYNNGGVFLDVNEKLVIQAGILCLDEAIKFFNPNYTKGRIIH